MAYRYAFLALILRVDCPGQEVWEGKSLDMSVLFTVSISRDRRNNEIRRHQGFQPVTKSLNRQSRESRAVLSATG